MRFSAFELQGFQKYKQKLSLVKVEIYRLNILWELGYFKSRNFQISLHLFTSSYSFIFGNSLLPLLERLLKSTLFLNNMYSLKTYKKIKNKVNNIKH